GGGRRGRARGRRGDQGGAARPARSLAGRLARRAAALGGVAPPRVAAHARRGARAPPGAPHMRKLTSFFFLATLFVATFEKAHWTFAGHVGISDILAILFLISF